MKLRILLADDHAILRSGVRSLIEATDRFEVVGEAADGLEALRAAERLAPDIVIIDIAMPRIGGLQALGDIVRLPCRPRVIVLSAHGEHEYIVAALRAGARGYLLKDAAFEEIRAALDTVARGRRYLGGVASEAAISGFLSDAARSDRPCGEAPSGLAKLSAREREILGLIAQSHTNDEIAGMLHISPHTVQTHRKRIMEKLGIHRAIDLARFALRHGLASVD